MRRLTLFLATIALLAVAVLTPQNVEAQTSHNCSGTDTSPGGEAKATMYFDLFNDTFNIYHRVTNITVTNVSSYSPYGHDGNFTYPTVFPTNWAIGDSFHLDWHGGAQFSWPFHTTSAGAYFGVDAGGSCHVTLF